MSRIILPPSPASGTGIPNIGSKTIRFVRHGCTNREFFHLVVAPTRRDQHAAVIEQLGSYDPMPNERNEKYLALNIERIRYWLTQGAKISVPAAEVLGDAGFLPIHPRRYMMSWRNRAKLEAEAIARAAEAAAQIEAERQKSETESSESSSKGADD